MTIKTINKICKGCGIEFCVTSDVGFGIGSGGAIFMRCFKLKVFTKLFQI